MTNSTATSDHRRGRRSPLRIGVLGAARITPAALIWPAQQLGDVTVSCVAARDRARARSFAAEHGIATVLDDYAAVIDADVDAIYIPLPISEHHHWTLRALEAGQHVLCEKALASNASEAREMQAAAARAGRVLMEAFHYRYHPLFLRVLDLVRSGAVGTLRRIEGDFCVPHVRAGDIRLDYETGGGALMDLGTYPVHWLRHIAGREPIVISASAEPYADDARVDLVMSATLQCPADGDQPVVYGRIRCSMDADERMQARLWIEGDAGTLEVINPLAPQMGHELRLNNADGDLREQVDRTPSYTYQLEAFAAAVRDGARIPTDGADAVAQMQVIDAIYHAAGLPLRGH